MSIKPLAMWAIHNQWTIRFTRRTPDEAQGELNTPGGLVPFRYEPESRRLHLPDRVVHLDPYGWEVDEQGRVVFRSTRAAQAGKPSAPAQQEGEAKDGKPD